jgi:hypothetical protein
MENGPACTCRRHQFDAGRLLDNRFQHWPRRFNQVTADLFEKVPPLLRRMSRDEALFGACRKALQADDEQIADQVRLDMLWAATNVILLETERFPRKSRLRSRLAFLWNPRTSALLRSQVRARERFGEAREKILGTYAVCRA